MWATERTEGTLKTAMTAKIVALATEVDPEGAFAAMLRHLEDLHRIVVSIV